MESTNNNSHKALGIGIGVVILALVIIICFVAERKSQNATVTDQASSAVTAVATAPGSGSAPASGGLEMPAYKNGTYSATGSYMSPGGEDQIGVTLTLNNDIIESVSVTPEPGDQMSAKYQAKFASGYQQYVVGKDISTLNVGTVSGSSLTPIGFNDAISKIKTEAQAS